MSEDRMFQIFLDIHRGLPRQGPGSNPSTLKALNAVQGLPEAPHVLDIGCGPGMQTLALAQALPKARITAVDLFPQFLEELQKSAEAEDLSHRITLLQQDMHSLDFPPQSFDLVWCEGAAYIMSVKKALQSWKPLLKPGACIAFTECTWLSDDRPQEVVEFWKDEYPAMRDVAGNLKLLGGCGYEVLDHFALPDEEWWTHYYTPLEAKLKTASGEYAEDEEGKAVIAMINREIDMKRRFPEVYGYAFFIARPKS